jgi:exopolysaccharide biosynthesis polyprenyl glycosylphosphotransferase
MRTIVRIASILLDAILVNLGILLSFFLRYQGRLPVANFRAYLIMAPYITIIWIGSLYTFGLYRSRKETVRLDLLIRATQSAIIAVLISVLATYLHRATASAFPSTVFLISWLVNIFLLSGWRFIYQAALNPKKKRVLVIGKGKRAASLREMLKKQPAPEYEIFTTGVQNSQKILQIIRQKSIDEVVVALPSSEHKKILDIILNCQEIKVGFKVQPDLYEIIMGRPKISQPAGLPLVDLLWEPISGWYGISKRFLELFISIIMLLVLLPAILVIGCLIKIDSPGPIFYKQERIGKNRRRFFLYKFRTMTRDAEKRTGPVLATVDDPRATKIGRILRRIGVDEIPQLWNVLSGSMSLVGPRPEREVFLDEYPQIRLSVKPGLTGLAQVNARFNMDRKEKIKYDLYYVHNPSFILDLNIILRTVILIIKQCRSRKDG